MSTRTSTRFKSSTVASLIATALAVSACGSAGPGGQSNDGGDASTITFGMTPTSNIACVKVTDERGFFRKHGITMKYGTPAPTGAAQVAQVINGQITVGYGAYTAVISAVSNNLPVVITNGVEQDYDRNGQRPLAVVVGKESGITSFKQLEGKTVAVNSLQGSWEILLKESVSKSGGDPGKVNLAAVPFPDQGAALRSGRVDAVFTLQPFLSQLNGEGFKDIGDPLATSFDKPDAITSVLFMARSFVDENPEVARNFTAALREGNEWCNAHPEEMRKAIARITQLPQDVVDKTPLPVYDAKIVSSETDTWGRLLVKYGILKEAPSADEVQWSGVLTQ